uniref:Uncharacterized protein n=1 Tax=Lepeophtheirus salmonis TaxID=72036 RepID=A0A0K2UCA0_LEPSM
MDWRGLTWLRLSLTPLGPV